MKIKKKKDSNLKKKPPTPPPQISLRIAGVHCLRRSHFTFIVCVNLVVNA